LKLSPFLFIIKVIVIYVSYCNIAECGVKQHNFNPLTPTNSVASLFIHPRECSILCIKSLTRFEIPPLVVIGIDCTGTYTSNLKSWNCPPPFLFIIEVIVIYASFTGSMGVTFHNVTFWQNAPLGRILHNFRLRMRTPKWNPEGGHVTLGHFR
jgi:hypothetical protein